MAKQTKPKGELIILDHFDQSKAELQTLAESYANLIVTEETYKEALSARMRIREARFAIQAQEKKNNDERISWNKKFLKTNTENAKSLIDIIFPTEEKIDAQLQTIEAKKEAKKQKKELEEKQRIDERNQLIIETGATSTPDGFLLDNLFVSHQEIKEFFESGFKECLFQFQEKQKHLIELEKEKQAIAQRTETRKKELFEIGFSFNGINYSHSLLQEVAPYSENLIQSMNEENWKEVLSVSTSLIHDAKETIHLQKEESDKLAEAQKQQAAELEKQRQQLETKKTALREQWIKGRKKDCFNLGMAVCATGFVFNGAEMFVEISFQKLENDTEADWENTLNVASEQIAKIKAEENHLREIAAKAAKEAAIEKEKAELAAKEEELKKRNEFLSEIPQIQKLRNRINGLHFPELESELGKSLLLQVESFMNDALCLIDEKIQ